MKDLVIIGTGDYAEMILKYVHRDCDVNVVCFSVEKDFIRSDSFMGLPVVAFEELVQTHPPSSHQIIAGIGPNRVNTVRERLYKASIDKGYKAFTYISPRAHVWNHAQVGPGSFIFDGCVVEPEARIGQNTVLWSNASVAHHSEVGDHCFLAPAAAVSGRIVVRDNCFLGINSTIRDNVVIAEKCIVGGGAVIKKNTIPGGVYSSRGADLLDRPSIETKV